jgi:hypothetical protein
MTGFRDIANPAGAVGAPIASLFSIVCPGRRTTDQHRWAAMSLVGLRTKAVCLALVLTALGLTQASGVYYETHCWAFGESPYRIGLVQIEDRGGVVTMICLGNEVGIGDTHPGCSFTVPLPIHVVAGTACFVLIVSPVFVAYALRRRRRRARTAQPCACT